MTLDDYDRVLAMLPTPEGPPVSLVVSPSVASTSTRHPGSETRMTAEEFTPQSGQLWTGRIKATEGRQLRVQLVKGRWVKVYGWRNSGDGRNGWIDVNTLPRRYRLVSEATP